jgi:branched-chain amino acid transport system ATP-binding protein
LLDVRGLSAWYGEVRALREVSFFLEAGEFVAILGANGAGKSTTIRSLGGIQRQVTGEVQFAGKQSLGQKSHRVARSGIGLSPEGRHVFPTLTVRENLLMGAYQRTNRKEVIKDLDRWFATFPRLEERSDQRAGSMSGGEQQMLAIARAMMSRPQLLMLDEPSLGLAPVIIDRMAGALRDLGSSGDLAVLLVEQNANLALGLASRGYVLQLGEIVSAGSSAELVGSAQLIDAYLGEGH